MNKLDPVQLGEDEADRLCDVLIHDACKQYGFDYEVQMHQEKLLKKYKYIKNLGVTHKEKKARIDTMSNQADVSKDVKALADGSSSSGDIKIKIENIELHNVQQLKKVLISAEPRITKISTELRRMSVDLKTCSSAVEGLKPEDFFSAPDPLLNLPTTH